MTDIKRSPARFSSYTDLAHLETQISLANGVKFSADTLYAYGTTIAISNPRLLQSRENLA